MNVYPCLKGVGIVLTAAAVLTACGQKPQPPARMPEVSYIVIGDMERSKYSGLDNTGLFLQFGNIAFISGDLMVIEIW